MKKKQNCEGYSEKQTECHLIVYCSTICSPIELFEKPQSYVNRASLGGGLDTKESACHAGNLSSVAGWKDPRGEGTIYLLQYSCCHWTEEPAGLQFMVKHN